MAEMTFEKYQELASRTAAKHDNEHINYAMGVAGESGELIDIFKKSMFHNHILPKDKIKKEAGDVLWYISQLMRIYQISFEDAFGRLKEIDESIKKLEEMGVPYDKYIFVSCLNLSQSAGNICGFIDGSRSISGFYSIDVLKGNIGNVLKNVYFLIAMAGLTIQEVAEANIEKLKKRYPEGFDPDKSINRVE